MNMIEKLARIICYEHRIGSGRMSEKDRQETVSKAWPNHVPEARAVLQALREPTEEMVGAGKKAIAATRQPVHWQVVMAHKAMIDKALED